jgi:hypothetical protein
MRDVDAEIFADIGEIAFIGSERVPGIFTNKHREIAHSDGSFVGVDISFDCQHSSVIEALTPGDPVRIVGLDDEGDEHELGTYRFHRRLQRKGDESGLVILDLLT